MLRLSLRESGNASLDLWYSFCIGWSTERERERERERETKMLPGINEECRTRTSSSRQRRRMPYSFNEYMNC
jgi:hypothetical protein